MSGGPLVPASAVRVGPDSTHASPHLSSFIGSSGPESKRFGLRVSGLESYVRLWAWGHLAGSAPVGQLTEKCEPFLWFCLQRGL